jgi:hypothetical protein
MVKQKMNDNDQAQQPIKPRDECLYYLIREGGGLGIKAKPVYFEDMLRHLRKDGIVNMSHLDIVSTILAAKTRGRLNDLDKAVDEGERRKKGEC